MISLGYKLKKKRTFAHIGGGFFKDLRHEARRYAAWSKDSQQGSND